jgi:hypothetical protein
VLLVPGSVNLPANLWEGAHDRLAQVSQVLARAAQRQPQDAGAPGQPGGGDVVDAEFKDADDRKAA